MKIPEVLKLKLSRSERETVLSSIAGPRAKGLKELLPYIDEMFVFAKCADRSFVVDVRIIARRGNAVLFEAPTRRFGIGVLNAKGDVVNSEYYSNITMAARSFLGVIKGP